MQKLSTNTATTILFVLAISPERAFCEAPVPPQQTFTVDRLTDTGEGGGLRGDLRYCITNAADGIAWPADPLTTLANGPISGPSSCVDDTWAATSTVNAPSARLSHTPVWTGTEMIIWGEEGEFITGGRYDPATDTWTRTSRTGAPGGRDHHTAVWTGTEMIVWGGWNGGFLTSGGRYDPTTDTWTPTSLTGAPSGRYNQTAVWTGTEMIIWGGSDGDLGYLTSGGLYDPATDSWTSTSLTGAPSGRRDHTAVWTGTEMIIWGGWAAFFDPFDSGGRYDPSTDTWTPTSLSGAPSGRFAHTAVWTGAKMIVWGGRIFREGLFFDTGGQYEPLADTWTPTSLTGVPIARSDHAAVWTATEMVVWGGMWACTEGGCSATDTGGLYCPL